MTLRSLSIVIPAHNEGLAIGETLAGLLGGLPPSVTDLEVLVVDDGSTDGTAEVVRVVAANDARVRCLSHERNTGKGGALRTGFAAARKEWVLLLDADQQVRTDGLRRVGGGGGFTDVVVGYRADRHDTPRRRLITFLFRALVRVALGVRVRDVNCPFKLFRRELIQSLPLRTNGFMVDAEILHLLGHRGVVVEEVPVAWYPRRYGRSTVRWRHFVQLVRELFIAREAPPGISAGPSSPARHWALAATVAFLGLAVFVGLEAAGRASRRIGTPALAADGGGEVVLARNGVQVVEAWRARGYRGRVIVHVGRFLHFVQPSRAEHLAHEDLSGVGTGRRLADHLASLAANDNYLWAAAEAGVAREVIFAEPAKTLRTRATALDLALADGERLDLEYRGFARDAGSELPRLRETVLLDIAASWFDEGTGEELHRMLERAGLQSDLVTLNLLDGSEDVSDAARNRLRAFLQTIRREERR